MEKLTFAFEEDQAPWEGTGPLSRVLDVMEDATGRPFESMDFRAADEWMPFDRAKLERELAKKREIVAFRAADGVEASVAKGPSYNVVRLVVPEPIVREIGIDALVEKGSKLEDALPRLFSGKAHACRNVRAIFDERQMPAVPARLGLYAGWLHIFVPSAFERAITRDQLLAAPAMSIEERPNGFVHVRLYDDPFACDTDEAREARLRFHRYLFDLTDEPLD